MKSSKDILLESFPYLDPTDVDLLLEDSHTLSLSNKASISEPGAKITHLYFIAAGMVRGYVITDTGEERTLIIRPTNSFSAAPEVLEKGSRSRYAFEAIQDTQLIALPIDRFFELASTRLSISKLYIAVLEEILKTVFFRVELLAGMSPEERYTRLLADRPELFQKSYHKYVANYLGITPNSLSRIIKRKKEG